MEAKLALAAIGRDYAVDRAEPAEPPTDPEMTLRMADGTTVRVIER
jgi:hypothetical protein